jgi:drug/metabolite transporter (DMT)-like permease
MQEACPNMAFELALLLLATLWGASYTFIKLGVATIPPITMIAARTGIAGLLLLVIMLARGVRMPRDLTSWRNFLVQAFLNSVIPWTLIAWPNAQSMPGSPPSSIPPRRSSRSFSPLR